MQTETMTERQKKGFEIAKRGSFKRKGDLYLVPAQSNPGTYVVDRDGDAPSCSCPDFELTQQACKHVFAVEYSIARQTNPDGTTTETRTVRVTYSQNWTAYNAAQTNEKTHFATLLRSLCDGIAQPPQGRGRPRLPLADVVFGAATKVYSTLSGRRAATDIRHTLLKGVARCRPRR